MWVKTLLIGSLLLLAGFYFLTSVLTQEVMPLTSVVGRVQASGDSYYMMKLASPATELKTEKPVYTVGEEVTFSFTNTGPAEITLRNSGPWVIKNQWGTTVFHPMAYMVVTPVRPGETKTWSWDQKDDNGEQVPEGMYTVELETGAGTYTATFEIRKSAGATLTVLASDFTNLIPGVPINVQPADLNGQADGTTPFTRQYNIGDHVTLTAPLPDPENCIWRGGHFHNWEIEKDAEHVQSTGGCDGRATVEIEITGPNPTVFAAFEVAPDLEPCAQLSTNKPMYNPGENVIITFTNNCTFTITLNCIYPWRIRDSKGQIVFEPFVFWGVVKVDPGKEVTMTWDQKNNDTKQVEEGMYTVEFETVDAGTYTATFEIRKPASVTLTVQASDFTNLIPGVPIKVQPADLNNQADGTTPFTRQYYLGDRVTLEVQLTDLANCAWNTYVFLEWQADEDAQILSTSGDCQNIIEIEITGLNPHITALFKGGAELCAQLSTDKPVYKPGETVTIRFTNNCIATINLNCDRPWRIKKKDQIVFKPENVLWVLTPVKPGKEKEWAWDQKSNKKQVEDGIYTVELDTMNAGTYTATFEIRKSEPATLTVQASDFNNSITGAPIKVQPADLNNQADGTTPFTRQYSIGDRVTLEVQLTDPANCAWDTYVFRNWRVDEDVQVVSISGECGGRATIEIEITGPNPRITAFFKGGTELCAQLSTDKSVYNPGETVTIKFTNNCTDIITLNYPDPWLIRNSEGRVVAGIEIQETMAVPVDPGETKEWYWSQTDILTKKQAQDGTYTVEFTTTDTGTLTTSFEIKTKTGPNAFVFIFFFILLVIFRKFRRKRAL